MRTPVYFVSENVWGVMTGTLTPELNGIAINAEQLWQRIQAAWEEITPALCGRLAGSMTDRLREVVDNGGAWTRY